MKKLKKRKDLVLLCYIPVFIFMMGVVLFAPSFAVLTLRLTYLFALLAVILLVSPFGKIRLGSEAPPSYHFLTWLGLLWGAEFILYLLFASFAASLSSFIPDSVIFYADFYQLTADWLLFPAFWYAVIAVAIAYACYHQHRPLSVLSVIQLRFNTPIDSPFGIVINTILRQSLFFLITLFVAVYAVWFNNQLMSEFLLPIQYGVHPAVLLFFTLFFIAMESKQWEQSLRYLWLHRVPMGLLLLGLMVLIVVAMNVADWLFQPFVGKFEQLPAFKNIGELLSQIPNRYAWHLLSLSWWIMVTPFVVFFIVHVSKGRTIRSVISAVIFLPLLLWMLSQQSEVQHYFISLLQNSIGMTSMVVVGMVILFGVLSTPLFREVVLSTLVKESSVGEHRMPWVFVKRLQVTTVATTVVYVLMGIAVLQFAFFTIATASIVLFFMAMYGFFFRMNKNTYIK